VHGAPLARAAAARVTASATRPAFPPSQSALFASLSKSGAPPVVFAPPRAAEPFLRALGLGAHAAPLAAGERPPEPPRVGEGFWPPDVFEPETFAVIKTDDGYARARARLADLRSAQARRKRDEGIDAAYT
jgi:hypothetical protein